MSRRTHAYWDPTRRASSVDHLIFDPHSNVHGGRVPAIYGEDDGFVSTPSESVPEEWWGDWGAGMCGMSIRAQFPHDVIRLQAWRVRSGQGDQFVMSVETDNAVTIPEARLVAKRYHVRVRVNQVGVNRFKIVFTEPFESVGGLYRHDLAPVPAQEGDSGMIQARSGRSGFRGARDRLERGMFGPQEAPKRDYEIYGMSPRYESPMFGSYEGGLEALVFGAVAVLATYRLMGGKPIFKV